MRAQPIKAIIFDFGGVLLDWNPRHLYRRYFEEPQQMEAFLKEINFTAWNARQDQGRPFVEAVAELSSQFPHHAKLIRAYHEHWEDSIAGPIAGTVLIARALKGAGYPLYGLTNWSAETFPLAYDKYDFLRLFDTIVVSGEVRLIKPDPQIFELTRQKTGQPAAHCLLIDDSADNLAVAIKMGFQTILYRSPELLEQRLLELGLLLPSWRETLTP